MAAEVLDAQTAYRAFVEGFTYMESIQPGSSVRQVGDLQCVHFGQPRTICTDEFMSFELDPITAHHTIQADDPRRSYWLTAVTKRPQFTVANYAALGYHFEAEEYLMSRPLDNLPPVPPNLLVRPVTNFTQAHAINQLRGFGLIRDVYLTQERLRFYYLADNGQPTNWAGMYLTDDRTAYITSVYTVPDYRLRGLSEALVSWMLAEAAKMGARHSVLFSSQAGHHLYQKLGYTDLAWAEIFKFVSSTYASLSGAII